MKNTFPLLVKSKIKMNKIKTGDSTVTDVNATMKSKTGFKNRLYIIYLNYKLAPFPSI
jgi:hypothetical protein